MFALNRLASARSSATMLMAASSDGKAATTIRQVTSSVQPNTGSRIMVTPGARIRTIVHSTVNPCSSRPVAARNTPATHRLSPGPGL